MCRGEEAAATRAARTIPLGGGGRGLQEIQTLRQEIGILTKHSRSRGRPAPGAPASLNPWPAGTQEGSQGAGGYPERRGWTPGGGPAGSPTPRLRRASRASVGPPASSAPHSRWPASSLLRCRRDRICPDKTLALGGAFLSPPTPGKDLGPSPILQRMNLKCPGRFPYFS